MTDAGNSMAIIEYAHFDDVMDWDWPNFTPQEMACRGTGKLVIVPAFMNAIQEMRKYLDFPFIVTSGYRSPEYNMQVSTTGMKGPHTTGRAIDLNVHHKQGVELVSTAWAYGIRGIGVQQKGAVKSRFIHLDNLTEEEGYPRPNIWSY